MKIIVSDSEIDLHGNCVYYKYTKPISKLYKDLKEDHPKIEDGLVIGDTIEKEGVQYRILGIAGEVFFYESIEDGPISVATLRTFIRRGFKLVPKNALKSIKKMTIEEVSKELGYDIEIITT
jgi:hypothetical protein